MAKKRSGRGAGAGRGGRGAASAAAAAAASPADGERASRVVPRSRTAVVLPAVPRAPGTPSELRQASGEPSVGRLDVSPTSGVRRAGADESPAGGLARRPSDDATPEALAVDLAPDAASDAGHDEDDELVSEPFFSTRDVASSAAFGALDDPHDLDGAFEATPAEAARRAAPDVTARRARYARIVTRGLGVLAGLCVIAAVKSFVTEGAPVEAPTAAAAVAAAAAGARVEASPAAARPVEVPPPPPPLEDAVGDEAAEGDDAREAVGTPAPAASAIAPAAPAASPTPARGAGAAKAEARRALEAGRLDVALGAAREATSRAPEDADAWLLLGAAHDARGDAPAARAAYASCVARATRGGVGECRALAP